MWKINKQDLIFIWKMLLYLVVSYFMYSFLVQHFIVANCYIDQNHIWYALNVKHIVYYACFWYLKFLNEYSILFYILFLWITIIPFIRNKYLFPNHLVFIIGIIIWILVILYSYKTSHIVLFQDLPDPKQSSSLTISSTWETWFRHK